MPQVVNSATVEKTSDGLQLASTDVNTVDIVPLGCGDGKVQAAAPTAAPAAAPADAAAAVPATPAVQRPADAPQLSEQVLAGAAAGGATAPVVPAVPVISAAEPGQVAVAATATQAVDAVVVTAPPGEEGPAVLDETCVGVAAGCDGTSELAGHHSKTMLGLHEASTEWNGYMSA